MCEVGGGGEGCMKWGGMEGCRKWVERDGGLYEVCGEG